MRVVKKSSTGIPGSFVYNVRICAKESVGNDWDDNHEKAIYVDGYSYLGYEEAHEDAMKKAKKMAS